ncbi:MAG: flagellar export protein FliJ [Deltaproteobacteria bacterium]|nr:flagellar export protein FliJ [Deltaproteobacteria bacterium]
MKQFSFRLDSILKYRNYKEKQARMTLRDVRNEYMGRRTKVKRLATKRIESIIRCRDEAMKGLNVPIYKIYQAFLMKLDHDLERADMKLQDGEKKVKAQEEILKGDSIKKKALETLKDLQFKGYMKELGQEEQRFMDEMVMIRRGGKA